MKKEIISRSNKPATHLMSNLSSTIFAKLCKLNSNSTLEPKVYANDNFVIPSCFLKTRLPEKYLDLAMLVTKCDDDSIFDSLACSNTFNADESDDLRPETQAIVDKLDVNKVGWDVALGMGRKPSPYDLDSIADCVIELFELEYSVRGTRVYGYKRKLPEVFDYDKYNAY